MKNGHWKLIIVLVTETANAVVPTIKTENVMPAKRCTLGKCMNNVRVKTETTLTFILPILYECMEILLHLSRQYAMNKHDGNLGR